MKSRDFCYWLMGSLEMNPENEENGLDEKQTQILKNHLNMCFAHVVTKEGELKKPKVVELSPYDYHVNC